MKTKLLLGLLLLGGTALIARPRVFVGIGVGGGYYPAPYYGPSYYAPAPVTAYAPPPAPPAYYAPPIPGPGYSWVDGYYYPVGPRYYWRGGYWARPPFAGAYWARPRYYGGRYYGGYWRHR